MALDLSEKILKRAKELYPDILNWRRAIHQNPEVGANLPQTVSFVKERLTEMGYEPREICESTVTAVISGKSGGKCVMLRADMDALKIKEQTELEFKSQNDCMHACGHDMHTAMLLGAAKLLKEFQSEINGTVKLVFQPDEEGFTGAKKMLAAGVLNDPKPDIGFALHVNSSTPSGVVLCGRGRFMAGCTLFRIRVNGVGCHGAMPENGVDPIFIAAQIYNAIGMIKLREIPARSPSVITFGKFTSGEAPNIIPQDAILEGTIRTFDRDLSASIFNKIEEISSGIAKSLGGKAFTEEIASAPPLINDTALVNEMAGYAKSLVGESSVYLTDEGGMGSEDFASCTYELPCAYLLLGAGTKKENPLYGKPMHNEKVVFNEEILPIGAALHTYCAAAYLLNG